MHRPVGREGSHFNNVSTERGKGAGEWKGSCVVAFDKGRNKLLNCKISVPN